MAKQTINVGTAANDKSGDPLRTAFQKANSNFTELYDRLVIPGLSGNTGKVLSTNGSALLWSPVPSPTGLANGLETLAIDAQGNILLDGSGPGAVNRGIVWKYAELYSGVNSKIYQSQDGLYVQPYTLGGTMYTWHFDGITGKLRLPAGSDIVNSEGASVIEANIGVATSEGGVDVQGATAINLGKSVVILDEGFHSLANGFEGQKIYFVPADNITVGWMPQIIVANAKYINGTTATKTTNFYWAPFYRGTNDNFQNTVVFAVFAGGAWNISGGQQD